MTTLDSDSPLVSTMDLDAGGEVMGVGGVFPQLFDRARPVDVVPRRSRDPGHSRRGSCGVPMRFGWCPRSRRPEQMRTCARSRVARHDLRIRTRVAPSTQRGRGTRCKRWQHPRAASSPRVDHKLSSLPIPRFPAYASTVAISHVDSALKNSGCSKDRRQIYYRKLGYCPSS